MERVVCNRRVCENEIITKVQNCPDTTIVNSQSFGVMIRFRFSVVRIGLVEVLVEVVRVVGFMLVKDVRVHGQGPVV